MQTHSKYAVVSLQIAAAVRSAAVRAQERVGRMPGRVPSQDRDYKTQRNSFSLPTVRECAFTRNKGVEREREKCYPHQARKAYLGSAMRDR